MIRRKGILIILLIVFLILNYFISTVYRAYIYGKNINDFGLADIGYNIFAVTTLSISAWIGLLKLHSNKIFEILLITLSLVLMELLSYFIPILGTFDLKDILALLLSGILTLAVYFCLNRLNFKQDWYKIVNN